MFYKNFSKITITFYLFLSCCLSNNLDAMDTISGLIQIFSSSKPTAFTYKNQPITTESFNELRDMAFNVELEELIGQDEESICTIPLGSYEDIENTFMQQYPATEENAVTLVKSLLNNISKETDTSIVVKHNHLKAEFTGGMAMLIHDIKEEQFKEELSELELGF